MGRSRRGRVASSGGASSVVGERGTMTEKRNLYLYLYLSGGVCTYIHIQSSPYFDPTHTRTGWIGQPPILNRHEVVTIDGDVDTLGQATP